MNITQKKIAQEAGVSQKTISQLFNGIGNISDETRSRVNQIIKKYNYRPNRAAREMRSRQFKRQAFVVFIQEFDENFVSEYARKSHINSNPAILDYINYCTASALEIGYSIQLEYFNVSKEGQSNHGASSITELCCDGIIACDAYGAVTPEIDKMLSQLNLPIVWLNRTPTPGINAITIDEEYGARLLAEHILDSFPGRKVVYFGPDSDHYSSAIRRKTLIDTIASRGDIESQVYLSPFGNYINELGKKVISEMDKPGVVVCHNRHYLEMIEIFAQAKGLKIPDDIYLVHFASKWETIHGDCYYRTYIELPEDKLAETGIKYLVELVETSCLPEGSESVTGRLHIGKTVQI